MGLAQEISTPFILFSIRLFLKQFISLNTEISTLHFLVLFLLKVYVFLFL